MTIAICRTLPSRLRRHAATARKGQVLCLAAHLPSQKRPIATLRSGSISCGFAQLKQMPIFCPDPGNGLILPCELVRQSIDLQLAFGGDCGEV